MANPIPYEVFTQLKHVLKKPIDANQFVGTMEEAINNSYPGYFTYVEETNTFVFFGENGEHGEYDNYQYWQIEVDAPKVGELNGGGRVFFVSEDKSYWLVAAEDPFDYPIAWDLGRDTVVAGTQDDVFGHLTGEGARNTDLIVQTLGQGYYAAKFARDYAFEGYSDWYLGSATEVDHMLRYLPRSVMNWHDGNNYSDSYWTSTQANSQGDVYAIRYSNGNPSWNAYLPSFYGTCYIRPIRKVQRVSLKVYSRDSIHFEAGSGMKIEFVGKKITFHNTLDQAVSAMSDQLANLPQNEDDLVHKSGNETITGQKTFEADVNAKRVSAATDAGAAITGYSSAAEGYGLVGLSAYVPVQATSTDTAPTGRRLGLVLNGDSEHTAVQNDYGMDFRFDFPWLGNSVNKPVAWFSALWTDISVNAENSRFEWRLRRGGAIVNPMSLLHDGTLVIEKIRVTNAAETAIVKALGVDAGGNVVKYTASGGAYTHPNHSGDVTSVGDGATTIAPKAVTLAKMADMATASLMGRNTAGTGVPEVIPVATVKTMLGLGTAAYTASTAYATSAQGTLATNAIPKNTVTTLNDFVVATGPSAVTRRTPAEVAALLKPTNDNYYASAVTSLTPTIPADTDYILSTGATMPRIVTIFDASGEEMRFRRYFDVTWKILIYATDTAQTIEINYIL